MSNDESAGRGRSWFKYGCLGCIAVLILLLVGAGAIMVIALMLGPPEEKVERLRLARELPAAPRSSPGDALGDRPAEMAPIGELVPLDAVAGRVVLGLSEGSFRIVPAPPGEPIRVEGRYDAGMYELAESFERQDDGGWVYRVSFDRHVSWIRSLFNEGEEDNRIKIAIPSGMPFTLEGRIGIGESILELGGLSLRAVDLELGIGAHELRFGEPTSSPMERFTLAAAIGELRVSGLGNAGPQDVSIRHRIGEVDIDLRGEWQRDADIAIRCGIGECAVSLPPDVAVELLSTDVGVGEVDLSGLDRLPPPDAGTPTLRLDLSGKVGEVRISQ
jgi:hypothetical protein